MNVFTSLSSATAVAVTFALAPLASFAAEDPFAANIRPTDPLSPAEEAQTFHLPAGFEIELFASEPDIHKPLNMAFDARGRLWVTDTVEYPYPAPKDRAGRDTIKILEDTDRDGRADRVTTFATGLNVPIGILPTLDGCIAWSIPNIWRFYDDDGDGVSDRSERLYGPFGWERDTHGMNNAFRRGFDGWVYACHGYNNVTTVRGADGHEVAMQSGNTYRFRLDGSRIEQWTHGQVNPFGSAFDELGNLYTSDCHSKPIYQLLRGAYYPSFGKPDDGLGFAPEMMRHAHGSTAICGLAIYTDEQFPPEYRGDFFIGNVMTSRVNHDSPELRGSSVGAHEEPDFIATDDPWFRPVDQQVGPDGALYVADFYNRIIGHYEVPLNHPGRDRFRGRIWRVVYRGSDDRCRAPEMPEPLDGASMDELVAFFDHPSLSWRMLALNQLCDRYGKPANETLDEAFRTASSARVRGLSLWGLARLGVLDESAIRERIAAAAVDASPFVRVQAMRILSESSSWTAGDRAAALLGLHDADAFVRRAAADAFGRHPATRNVAPLLDLLARTDANDDHLVHTVRMALRDQLLPGDAFGAVTLDSLSERDAKAIASVSLGVPSRDAGEWLVRYLERYEVSLPEMRGALEHAAAWIGPEGVGALARLSRERLAANLDAQVALLEAVRSGLESRGVAPPEELAAWGRDLAAKLVEGARSSSLAWTSTPIAEKKDRGVPWTLERRKCDDGVENAPFVGSLPRGEQLTGILRSRPFEIPARISFYLAGHDGFPDKPHRHENLVRLLGAESGHVLAETLAPRNDVARRIEWDLAEHAGEAGVLEIVDGDEENAYAWIALGRIEPEVVPLPAMDPAVSAARLEAACNLAARLELRELAPAILELVSRSETPAAARDAGVRALAALARDARVAAVVSLLSTPAAPPALATDLAEIFSAPSGNRADAIASLLEEAARALPLAEQATFALALARDARGADALFALVEAGRLSARTLARPRLREALVATGLDGVADRIETLLAELPDEEEARQKLIDARRAYVAGAETSVERGHEIFRTSCAPCHRIGEEGKVVGPQLDGIGSRGLERILEDVLAPNRNVDIAFRTTTAVTKRGEAVAGLLRSADERVLRWVDVRGEEFTLPAADVDSLVPSNLSLMPDNFGEVLSERELADLLAFLLEARAK